MNIFYSVGQAAGWTNYAGVTRIVRITHIVHSKGRQRLYFRSPIHKDERMLSMWNTKARVVV